MSRWLGGPLLWVGLVGAGPALGQSAAATPASAAPVADVAAKVAAPDSAASDAARRAPSPQPPAAPGTQRVDIQFRNGDTDARRRASSAKLIIGRDELDKFGDSSVGEVLRRLPGVTTPGAPGRGGAPRLRGLGGGYTQMLMDGQRMPPGFSLDSINPDQIERIEILRAPTAETGARAIAGTINIVMREGYRRRVNELRLGFAAEGDRITPGLSWTRNDSAGPLLYNLSLNAFDSHQARPPTTTTTTRTQLSDGALIGQTQEISRSVDHRQGLGLNGRLQWRLGGAEGAGEGADTLVLQPSVFHNQGGSQGSYQGNLPSYASASSDSHSSVDHARLALQWRGRLGEAWRFDHNLSVSRFQTQGHILRLERDAAGALLHTLSEDSQTRQTGSNLSTKLSTLLDDRHSLVMGLEAEPAQRTQTRTSLDNGHKQLEDFGDSLSASSLRLAAFGQDEWTLNPQWSANAGLRWESIRTQGEAAGPGQPATLNRSAVWTPLAHAVWKPQARSPNQWRLGLTRSYRSPDLGQLIARPALSNRYPAEGANTATSPDSQGNPALRPELATGLDLAYEHYFAEGGVLSTSLFHRRIEQVIRNVTRLQTVSWSPVPRWVSQPQNIGNAHTEGLEFELKARGDQLFGSAAEAPSGDNPAAPTNLAEVLSRAAPSAGLLARTELRANLSLYRSAVEGIPGPNNRLSEQPQASANIGFDQRLRGLPLSWGGNLNWVPGYRTQLAADRTVSVSTKRVIDVYALWSFSPDTALRVLLNNLEPRDYSSVNALDVTDPASGQPVVRESARTLTPSRLNVQVRLELKL